jgi:uracil phosphoribosyltransferase
MTIIDHPLVQHKMAIMRDIRTGPKEFREIVKELTMLVCYEAMRDLPLSPVQVQTPLETTECHMIDGKKMAVVPILRAGLGMMDGVLDLVPAAKVGHIGVYRDHGTLEPVQYYYKMPPDIAERTAFVVDPMLATGGSACDAIAMLKQQGCTKIKLMVLVAAPEGVKKVEDTHPDVRIYAAALDRGLNENGYIMPGLGDAGDRIFGTK